MLTLVLVCLIPGLVLLFFYRRANSAFYKKAALMPGPTPWPLVGNGLEFGTTSADFLKNVKRVSTQYGPVTRVWMGPKLFVLLTDAKDVELVLSSNHLLTKAYDYNLLSKWLGLGLLTNTGDKWRKHRKIITPTFHFKILEQFVEVFNGTGEVLIDRLRKEVNGPAFSIYNYMTLLALDVICESAMGVKVDAQLNSDSKYVRAVNDICKTVVKRLFLPWLRPNFIFNLTKYAKLQKECLTVLQGKTNEVINERMEALKNKGKEDDKGDDDGIGTKKKMAFLDLLIESSKNDPGFSAQDIRDEVNTFMFEGHDTTSSGMSFALWCLANHQDVQEKVVEELQTVLGSDDRPLTLRDLQELNYLERVIKEVQRMFPSVPSFGREIHEDLLLNSGYMVPAGSTLLLLPFVMHFKSEYFPDPEKFDPDRFLKENSVGRNPYAYVPFSAGPRNCIGQKFAMLEMKSTIAKVLRNYKLLPDKDGEQMILTMELILKSQSGINLKLVPRS